MKFKDLLMYSISYPYRNFEIYVNLELQRNYSQKTEINQTKFTIRHIVVYSRMFRLEKCT